MEVRCSPVLITVATGAFASLALTVAVSATLVRGDIAASALFGLRAPADPLLGGWSLILALVPWAVAALAWRRGATARTRSMWLLAFGTPGTLGWRIRLTSLATLAAGLAVVVASTSLL